MYFGINSLFLFLSYGTINRMCVLLENVQVRHCQKQYNIGPQLLYITNGKS